jgi:hypothetical protein
MYVSALVIASGMAVMHHQARTLVFHAVAATLPRRLRGRVGVSQVAVLGDRILIRKEEADQTNNAGLINMGEANDDFVIGEVRQWQ